MLRSMSVFGGCLPANSDWAELLRRKPDTPDTRQVRLLSPKRDEAVEEEKGHQKTHEVTIRCTSVVWLTLSSVSSLSGSAVLLNEERRRRTEEGLMKSTRTCRDEIRQARN